MTEFPLLALYAETHFRFFRGFPSILFRRHPEIVFDLPRRIAPRARLPVLLLINDIDRFPLTPETVTIAINSPGTPPSSVVFDSIEEHEINHSLIHQSRAFIFHVDRSRLPKKAIFVNATLTYTRDGKKHTVLNDNLRTSTKNPFRCLVADTPLPGSDHCRYGDLHVHTQFSQSHVEFGPPIAAIQELAGAYGVDFLGITDHSYDLFCAPDNYLEPDPSCRRWKMLLDDIARLRENLPILIPGEEISAFNGRGNVVHLCGLGMDSYIEGGADGARQLPSGATMHSLPQAIDLLHKQGALAVAAHPGAKVGLLQRLFLNRGVWKDVDTGHDLDAFQAVNSGFFGSWYRGKSLWIKMLLGGRRIPLLGGNDAHGDFNRYRSIGIPFLSVTELPERHFAGALTGVYGQPSRTEDILAGIRAGKTFVTEGPFLTISSSRSPDATIIGSEISPETESLFALFSTTYETGTPVTLIVLQGRIGGEETVVLNKTYDSAAPGEFIEPIPISPSGEKGYLRAELLCKTPEGLITHAVTSPGYFVGVE